MGIETSEKRRYIYLPGQEYGESKNAWMDERYSYSG